MSEAQRLVKNTGIIAVGGMATKVVQFLLLPLYTSILSTGEYGTVDYVNTIALFCVPAVSLLMDEALFRFLIDCKSAEDRQRVISTSCAVFLVGWLALAACAAIIWAVANPDYLGWIVGLILSGCFLQIVSAVLRGYGDTAGYALMNFLAGALTVALNVVFLAVLHLGVQGMLAATVLSQGIMASLFFLLKRMWRHISLKAIDARYARELASYSIPLVPNKVSWMVMNLADRLVIMNALGASAAGVYAIAYKLPNFMDTVNGFFYQSWRESSARVLRSGEDIGVFYNAVYKTYRRFAMGVVLIMVAFTPAVYALLINPSYAEGMRYVPVLLLSMYFSNMSGFYGGVFTAHRDTGIMGTTTIVSAAICLVLCFVLIPVCGLWGATAATLVATIVVNEYRRVKTRRYVALDENRKEQAATAVALVTLFSFFYAHVITGSWLYVAAMLAVSLSYFTLMNRTMLRGLIEMINERR